MTVIKMLIKPSQRMRPDSAKWDHEIRIALPSAYYESEQHYPVLWVTDGHGSFDIAVELVKKANNEGTLPAMIIVGVGCPPDDLDAAQRRREYDFNPVKEWLFDDSGGGRKQVIKGVWDSLQMGDLIGGGATGFLDFLVDQVRPALATEYRMATSTHVLMGHSAGGVFVAYTLLARPQAFTHYICSSPALYAGNYHLFELETQYAAEHDDLSAAAFFCAGENELLEGSSIAAWGCVSSMAAMVEQLSLREYPSLRLHARIFPGENHGTVVPYSLSEGLQTLLINDEKETN